MKRSKRKKILPPWVSVVVIAVVVIAVAVVYWLVGRGGHGKVDEAENLTNLQKFINEGGAPPIPRHILEARGVIFPPNYEQLVAARAAKESGRPAGRGPGARGPMR